MPTKQWLCAANVWLASSYVSNCTTPALTAVAVISGYKNQNRHFSHVCFSVPLMTVGMSIRSAKTMRRTTLSFASQIFVCFHVNIQHRRLPVVFFHVVIQPCVTYAADRAPLRGLFWGAVPKFCPHGIQNYETTRHSRSLAGIVTGLDHTFFIGVSLHIKWT